MKYLVYVLVALIFTAVGYVLPHTSTFGADRSNITNPLVFQQGTFKSYSLSTSTPASMTMKQSDLLWYDSLVITPTIGAVSMTLPATSTLTQLVPSAGDVAEQCWLNATGTAAATITIVAGTGFDLEQAATSTTVSVPIIPINAGASACIKFVRKANTDIAALVSVFKDAD